MDKLLLVINNDDIIESKIDTVELFPRRKFGKDTVTMKEVAATKNIDKW